MNDTKEPLVATRNQEALGVSLGVIALLLFLIVVFSCVGCDQPAPIQGSGH